MVLLADMLSKEVANLWRDYKLSDAIGGWNNRKGLDKPFIDYCCDTFPGSIMCDYRRMTHKFNDVATLSRIVRRRALLYHTHAKGCLSLPSAEQIVVHLRLGDTFGPPYVRPISSYAHLRGKNLTVLTNVQRTRSRTDLSHNASLARSLQYLQAFENFVGTVTYRSCLPDEDFIYMALATHFEKAGGGFSFLVHTVNQWLQHHH
jgi:hypothetical protein